MDDQKRKTILELTLRHRREMEDLQGSSMSTARENFKQLFTWTPECMPEEVLKAYEENGGTGVPPFFCEITLYELLGKGEARDLLAIMRLLGEGLGFTRREMHRRFKEKKVDLEEDLTLSDLDAFESILREEDHYFFDPDSNGTKKRRRFMRTLKVMREQVQQ